MSMMPPGMGGLPGMPAGMGGGVMPPGMGMSQPAGMPGMNADGSFDLSLSDDVVPPSEYEPIPAGTYNLFASKVEVTPTKAGEPMIVIHWALDGAAYGSYEGRIVRDTCVVPGPHRRQEQSKDGRDKWTVMMGMLRDWLEAITGRPWRENQMNLNPARDLSSLTVQAAVTLEPWTKQDADGNTRSGVNNRISRYLQAGGVRAASPFGMPAPGIQAPSMPMAPAAPAMPAQPAAPVAQPVMQEQPQQAVQEQPQPPQFVPPTPPVVQEDNPTITPGLGEPPSRFDV